MKRNIFIVITLLILLVPNLTEASEGEFRVFINGEQFTITNELGAPFIDNLSRTQIPIRAISEGLGHEVKWNNSTETVTISKSETEDISLTIGSNQVTTSNETITMDTEAMIKGERTYVPLRFASEALGYSVDYQWKGYHSISIADSAVEPVFYRPDYQSLPDEIVNWIEFSKELPLVQEKRYDGKRFVLITEGMKPTGGYSLDVEEVDILEEELVIRVKSTKPGENDYVTQAITYPYDLIVVENKELPLKFIDVDDEDRYFMNLLGIDAINKPIVAASNWIKVFKPQPNEQVAGTFKLAGIANVFEGTVSYELITEKGDVLHSSFTTAAMGDWAYFEEEIQVPGDVGNNGILLELYSESMKDGSKMFEVTIPLSV
ncbi:MAG: protease complex subunit PrcB family protein [Firmicutes bacterium]|nr:protease complex subunit PrcB family protein [Bacillota bacterium]